MAAEREITFSTTTGHASLAISAIGCKNPDEEVLEDVGDGVVDNKPRDSSSSCEEEKRKASLSSSKASAAVGASKAREGEGEGEGEGSSSSSSDTDVSRSVRVGGGAITSSTVNMQSSCATRSGTLSPVKLYPNHSRNPNPNLLVVHSKSYTDIFSSDGFVFKFSSAVVEMLLFAPPGELAPRLGLFIARTKVDHGST